MEVGWWRHQPYHLTCLRKWSGMQITKYLPSQGGDISGQSFNFHTVCKTWLFHDGGRYHLLRKSVDWCVYDNGLRHERVKVIQSNAKLEVIPNNFCCWLEMEISSQKKALFQTWFFALMRFPWREMWYFHMYSFVMRQCLHLMV